MLKVKNNDMCTFCSEHVESISHLMWECAKVKLLWQDLKEWLKHVIDIEHFLNIKSVILGVPDTDGSPLGNWIVLRTKYYIYCRKCCGDNLNLQGLKHCLLAEHEMEKFIATENGNQQQLAEKWEDFETLF